MKAIIHLVCNDIALFNIFSGSGLFKAVTIGSAIEEAKYDCLVVSDRIISSHDFLEMVDKRTVNANHIFYMLSDDFTSNRLASIKVRLKAKDVKVIPPKMTEKQIFERLCQEINIDAKANRNVVFFVGADAKVGTTMTAQCAAEVLAESTSCTVGLLNLQGHVNFSYIKDSKESYGLDTIKTKVFNSVLSPNELKEAMIKSDNLHVLPSVRTLTDIRYYHPRHVEYLVDIASDIFDIVVIDAGCDTGSGLYIGSLNSTVNRYMVATQQESCRLAYQEIAKAQVFNKLEIDTYSFYLIVNRYSGLLDYAKSYKFAEENYFMNHGVFLPNVNNAFWQTEIDRKTLRNYKNTEYNKNLNDLVRIIAEQLNIDFKENMENQKNRWFSFLK